MGKADETRAALLRAAVEVIGKQGYTAATVDKIAEAAGVSKGDVYYHFKTKGDIATSVLVNGMQQLLVQLKAVSSQASSGVDALHSMITSFSRAVFYDPALARFMLTELWRDDRIWTASMRELEDECVLLIQEQIERGQEEGDIRDSVDARFGAVAVMGTVFLSTQYYLMNADPDSIEERSRIFEGHVLDYIAHALKA